MLPGWAAILLVWGMMVIGVLLGGLLEQRKSRESERDGGE